MTREEGLLEIQAATWVKDEYGYLHLTVHDSNGRPVTLSLHLRPHYCDRGHIQMNIEESSLYIDTADAFPRFFFSFEEANTHARLFLKWRIWQYRVHPHKLEIE